MTMRLRPPDRAAARAKQREANAALQQALQEREAAQVLAESFQAAIDRLARLNQENPFAVRMAHAYGVKTQ